MPIATVSREPGRIEAYNGANLSGAQPCDQAVEAGACHSSACRAAEIIINDFNVDKTALAGDVDQIIWRRLLSKLVITWDCAKKLAGRSPIYATHQDLAAEIWMIPVADFQFLP